MTPWRINLTDFFPSVFQTRARHSTDARPVDLGTTEPHQINYVSIPKEDNFLLLLNPGIRKLGRTDTIPDAFLRQRDERISIHNMSRLPLPTSRSQLQAGVMAVGCPQSG